MSTIQLKIPTAFNIDLEFEAANVGQRLLAWLIDLAVRLLYLFLTLMGLSAAGLSTTLYSVVLFFLVILPVSFYFIIAEISMHGQTPGKRALGITVVSLSGNQPTFSQHLLRWVFRIIESPFVLFGIPTLIAMVRSSYHQRIGDIVGGTIVVNTRNKNSINDTIFRDMSQIDYQPHFPQILKLSDKDLNKVKELLDKAIISGNSELAYRVSARVREVLHIETDMEPMVFLETVLNDYNYYTTKN